MNDFTKYFIIYQSHSALRRSLPCMCNTLDPPGFDFLGLQLDVSCKYHC